MKSPLLVFSFVILLLAGCGAETLVGPGDTGAVLEPAEECSINAQLC